MTGADIARRAHDLIGAPFRLHGREGRHGVDCVGLVAHAAGLMAVPRDYMMRGDYAARVTVVLQSARFRAPSDHSLVDGDILSLRCGPRQMHLAVVVGQGVVHAHAGLRRVVWTPAPLPWPLLNHWRISGD